MRINECIIGALTAFIAATTLPVQAQKNETADKKLKEVTFKNTRNMRFGEIVVVKKTGIEVYNTTGVNDCPAKLWDALDPEKLAKELGALKVEKNGPHYWMMDSQSVGVGEKASFGGLEARWVATLDPAAVQKAAKGSQPYKVFNPKKTQKMVYSKGKAVYQLVDGDGHIYVMQARDEKFPIESLAKLGERLKLPKGWQFQSRILKEDLVINLVPDRTAHVVGDDFHQYYTRIPKTK